MKIKRSNLSAVVAAVLALFITSCGEKKNSGSSAPDTPDSLTDELLVKMDELAAAITTAKDKESAEKAAETITAIGDDFTAIAERLDALDEPSEEVKKQIDEKMDDAMEGKQEKMMTAMQSISDDEEIMAIISKAIRGFNAKTRAAEATFQKFGKK